jgi:hypothetical protein
MIVELLKCPPLMVGEESLPSILKAKITLALILADLTIDFSIARFLLV